MIFPNPVGHVLNYMIFRRQNHNSKANISVIDAAGHVLEKEEIQLTGMASRNSLTVHSLKKGTYFLRVSYQNGETTTKKFIKK